MEISDIGSLLLINDSYNANPESMRAALETLRYFAQERGGRAWAFIGKMHELGENSQRDHQSITAFADQMGIDHVVAVNTPEYGNTSGAQLLVQHVSSFDEALAISKEITPGDVILVKGSRAEGLEKLSDALKNALLLDESAEESGR
jgi:UDP-N-acetylmuramoyl-tripeptide--D-alanyl-D-alanine ligase